jgi:hypothetical protein
VNRYLLIFLLLAFLGAAVLWPRPEGDRGAPPARGLPWQIEVLPGGASNVFGVMLGESTIGEAIGRFGRDVEVAVVARSGETGTLEAYYDTFSAGPLMGRLVVVADLDAETIRRFRERAAKTAYMDSGARKFTLRSEDLPVARQARIVTITFVPSANFDEETALKRFGAPAERVRVGEHAEHFLYPHLGLDLLLDAKGKEVLQYVAPRDFERLRAPLIRGPGIGDHNS